jgi:magnesium transporter
MIRARLLRSDHPPVEAEAADWSTLFADDANILWIDLDASNEEEFAQVTRRLDIDARAAKAARSASRRPGVLTYEQHYLVTAHWGEMDEEHGPVVVSTELDMLVGKNYLISLHERPLPFSAEVEDRIAAYGSHGRFDASFLLYVLLHSWVVHHERVVEGIEEQVAQLEEDLLGDPGRGGLNRAVELQRQIRSLRHLVLPHRETFSVLVTPDSPISPQNVEPYFRASLTNLNRLIDRLDHLRDIASGSYNLYISNVSYRTNQQLRVLTFLSAVLLPMTVITGLFGTNFTLSEYRAWEPFYAMLAGMGLIAAGMLAFFHWRRWF